MISMIKGEKYLKSMNDQRECENTVDFKEKKINSSKLNQGVGHNFEKYLPQFLIEDLNKINEDGDSKLIADYEIHEARETEDPLDFSEFEKCIDAFNNKNASNNHPFSSNNDPKLFLESQSKNSIRPPFKKKFHSNKEVSSYAKGIGLISNSTLDLTNEDMRNNNGYRNIYTPCNGILNKNPYNNINYTSSHIPINCHINNHSSKSQFQSCNDTGQFHVNDKVGNYNNHKPIRSFSNSYVNSNYIEELRNCNNTNCNYNKGLDRSNNPIGNQNIFYYNDKTINNNTDNCFEFTGNNQKIKQNSFRGNYIQGNFKNNYQVNYPNNNEYVNNLSSYSNLNTLSSFNSLNNMNNIINLDNFNSANRIQNLNPNFNNMIFNQSEFNNYFQNSERNFNFESFESNMKDFEINQGNGYGLKKFGSHGFIQYNNHRQQMDLEEIERANIKSSSAKVVPKMKNSNQSLCSPVDGEDNLDANYPKFSQQVPSSTLFNSKKQKTSLFNNNSESVESTKSFNDLFTNLKTDLHLFITTQKGSRTMQKFLDKISSDNLNTILDKLKNHFAFIMKDIYGNYFCQRLIQCCTSEQRIFILRNIHQDFPEIARNSSGTHSLQSLIEIINIQKEGEIILEGIRGNVLNLSLDSNATHVIQKLILCIQESNRDTINQEILTNFEKFVRDSNGICVLKKFINKNNSLELRKHFLEQISKNVLEIVQNPFGNYVIQFVLEYWGVEIAYNGVLKPILTNVVSLSMQKFSSNVVEKCLQSNETIRKEIIKELFDSAKIASLVKNKYGNFVLQKAIILLNDDDKRELKEEILKRIKATSSKEKTRLNKLIEML